MNIYKLRFTAPSHLSLGNLFYLVIRLLVMLDGFGYVGKRENVGLVNGDGCTC